MNCKKLLCLVLVLLLGLSGCAKKDQANKAPIFVQGQTSSDPVLEETEQFSDRDLQADYDSDKVMTIQLQGSTAQSDEKSVKITGSTIAICGEGTYLLTGQLDNGMVIVNASKEEKVQLVLRDAKIHSATSAALYIQQADKVFVTLEGENSLSNGGSFTAIDENNIDAAVFSKEDITFNGEGKLTVQSPAAHGIVSKDDLVITQGSYQIEAGSHGIAGKDSLRVADGNFQINAGKDGLHAENNDEETSGYVYISNGKFHITAQGDGISSAAVMQIDGGEFHITAGGGSSNAPAQSDDWMFFRPGYQASQTTDSTSTKGIKSGADLVIRQGTFDIDSCDDAIHSNAAASINDGQFQVRTGDDGFHAETELSIHGGSITVEKSYEGLEGMTITINGGELDLTSSDDGLNAAGGNDQSGMGGMGGNPFATTEGCGIFISGGKLQVNAQGDGIDSNGTVTVTGGETYVSGPNSGANGALDYNGSASITGGTFIAVGTSQMAQNFSSAENQGAIMVNVSGLTAADNAITLKNSQGQVIFSWQPEKVYSSIVLSCPGITQGQTYTLQVGSFSQSITMTNLITGGSGGMGGMGGMPGGGMPGGGMPGGGMPGGGRPNSGTQPPGRR